MEKTITQEFVINGKIALAIQKTRMAVATRIYSHLAEHYIRKHKNYPILEEQRKDKTADRKDTAILMKKLLKMSLKEENRTIEDFNKEFEQAKEHNSAFTLLTESEKEAFKQLRPHLKQAPIFQWLKAVKGLGTRYYVKLLVYIKNPQRFHHPSALRKYCGTAPGLKLQRGQEACFVPELKGILLGQIAKNFLMNNSPYKTIYDAKKRYYTIMHTEDLELTEKKKQLKQKITKDDWTPLKIHNYSIKAMMNRFLVDFWEASFLIEGKNPPCNPYILNDPKHNRLPMVVPVTKDMRSVVLAMAKM